MLVFSVKSTSIVKLKSICVINMTNLTNHLKEYIQDGTYQSHSIKHTWLCPHDGVPWDNSAGDSRVGTTTVTNHIAWHIRTILRFGKSRQCHMATTDSTKIKAYGTCCSLIMDGKVLQNYNFSAMYAKKRFKAGWQCTHRRPAGKASCLTGQALRVENDDNNHIKPLFAKQEFRNLENTNSCDDIRVIFITK